MPNPPAHICHLITIAFPMTNDRILNEVQKYHQLKYQM